MDPARLALWILYAATVCVMIYGIAGGRGWRRILRGVAVLGAAALALWLAMGVLRRIGGA